VRLEHPEDYRAVENLTDEAFWGFTGPTCDEHYLVHLLRRVPAFVPGSALMRHSMREARQLGYGAIVFYGHPDYYPRFGFRSANAFDRTFPHKEPVSMIPIDVLTGRLQPAARKAFAEHNITTPAWLNRLSGRELLEWDGIDAQAMAIINEALREHGYAAKLLPSSPVLQLAGMGVRIPVVTPIRVKDGISVYRVEPEGDS
jgi:hypothetical protein